MKIDSVDEEAALEVVERDLAYQVLDQHFERLTAIKRGREETAKGYVSAGHLEHIAPADQPGPSLHVTSGDPSGPRGADQGPDARANHQTGDQVPLFQRAEHTNVGQAFQPSTTQYQSKGTIRYHARPHRGYVVLQMRVYHVQ